MKKFYSMLSISALFFMGACQNNDGEVVTPVDNGETTKVEFELDASSLAHDAATRTYSPTYTADGFSIYAFKENAGGDFVFNKKINMTNMEYKDGKWVVSDNLPIGTYKFVHAYGIEPQAAQTNLRLVEPTWNGLSLNNNMMLGFNGSGPMTEIFLETDEDAGSLQEYSFAITDDANQTVSATLKRAVSRVDLMFISAVREPDGTFREVPYSGEGDDIFGGKVIKNIELQFTEINNQMNLFGIDGTSTRSAININLNDTDQAWYKFNRTITVGAEGITATKVGNDNYFSYDNVQPADIIEGSAHIFGSYLFPNNTNARTAGLKMIITPTDGDSRPLTITTDNDTRLPLERNKVTLVKVYVLNNNNVFSTTVDFEVEIITAWEDANEVSGIIS